MLQLEENSIWKAMADPVRRSILQALQEGSLTTGQIVGLFPDLCRTAVMKHLEQLVVAGLVRVRREGRTRRNESHLEPLFETFKKWTPLREATPPLLAAFQRLKETVELPIDHPSGARENPSHTIAAEEPADEKSDGKLIAARAERGTAVPASHFPMDYPVQPKAEDESDSETVQ